MSPEERIIAYGSPDARPTQLKLKAGQLEMIYEKGSLRWIRLGNTEIIRMIYSAVRDRNWGTIEPRIESESIQVTENSFGIELKVCYQSGPIHFIAEYTITGANNTIRFKMSGIAQSDFLKNRIGFCVLHPIRECAGKPGCVTHPDERISDFVFPEQISPNQPVKNIRAMSWEPAAKTTAKLYFSGDTFEMEDQRNWTDASFKTYCTPLELPFPAEIKKGEKITQLVELVVETENHLRKPKPDFVFSWQTDRISKFPELGTAISSRKEALTQHESSLLKKLPMKHLRVEVQLNEPGFRNEFEKASRESNLLGWSLFVVLYLSENQSEEVQQFIAICLELNLNVKYILPVGKNHLPHNEFNAISDKIRKSLPFTLIGTGVNAYFAELNRSLPTIDKADFVSFAICPQVHAFDHASLVENLEAQAEVVSSAQKLFPDQPVFVSPVSLRQRFNVVATSTDPEPVPGVLPPSVDPRQLSVFAASWTLGSLKYLAQANTNLISYYETTGWKGFIQGEKPSPVKRFFPSEANQIFPVYEAMKEISGFSHVIHSRSSHPLLFDGLVLRSEQEIKLFLFSFSPEELELKIDQLVDVLEIKSMLYPSQPDVSGDRLKLRAWDLVIIRVRLLTI